VKKEAEKREKSERATGELKRLGELKKRTLWPYTRVWPSVPNIAHTETPQQKLCSSRSLFQCESHPVIFSLRHSSVHGASCSPSSRRGRTPGSLSGARELTPFFFVRAAGGLESKFPHLLASKTAYASPNKDHPLQRKDPSLLTREDCKVWQELGLEGYPSECKILLEAASKTGILARRKSSVSRTWHPHDGHGSRSMASESPAEVGPTYDVAKDGKSVEDLILEQKSAAEIEKIAELKMRTLSRGGKIDTSAVEKELKRRESQKTVPIKAG